MRIAIVGSRTLNIKNLGDYLPEDVTEIVSGGADGIDTCASDFAKEHSMKCSEFLPNYKRYGRAAPIIRNKQIVDYADRVIAFWDGKSRGTKSVIDLCFKEKKPIAVYHIDPDKDLVVLYDHLETERPAAEKTAER